MWKNYLIVALRIFTRNRLYTGLAVASLTIAFGAALLVASHAVHEVQYDRFHERAGDLYRLVTHSTNRDVERSVGFVPLAMAPYLHERFPAVEHYARVWEYRRAMPVTHPGRGLTFYEEDFGWAEASFFDLFDFEILSGDAEQPLRAAHAVVLSESAARRYFGDANPIGATLHFRAETDIPLQVTAVMHDFPATSHLKFDFVANMETAEQRFWAGGNGQGMLEEWVNLFVAAYVLMRPGADLEPILTEATVQINERLQVTGSTFQVEAQPLTSIHLNSNLDVGEFEANGSLRNLLAVLAIGLIILALGCFNFINLVTAQAAQRIKEVGVRKTLGSSRRQLMLQHYVESLLLVAVAAVLAFAGAEMLRPVLPEFAQSSPVIDLLAQPQMAAFVLLGLVLVTLLAGAYPALYLARFAPAMVIKEGAPGALRGGMLRRVLVTLQFGLSALLIVCTVIIYQQLHYMKKQDLGFAKEQLVVIPIHNDGAIVPNIPRLKQVLTQHDRVRGLTASSHLMLDDFTYQNTFHLEGEGAQEHRWERYTVESDYAEVYDLQLIAGRSFRAGAPSDTNAVMLNEQAVRELGLTPGEVIGRRLVNASAEVSGQIVGVIRDFHYQSLREAIRPFVLVHRPEQVDYITVQIAAHDAHATLDYLKTTWHDVIPEAAFGYYFLDETFEVTYAREERLTRLVLTLSGIALFLACLGLFGLSAHAAARRTKEIGVRKVLGASAWDVVRLLGADFTRLVALALVVALPLAYVLMHRWLADFAYRVDPSAGMLLAVAAAVLLLAWTAMGYQAVRAALTDPVESLRYE